MLHRTFSKQRRLAAVIQSTLLGLPSLAVPMAALTLSAYCQAEEREYQIPAGALSSTLSQFASEAGVLLSVDAQLTDGRSSAGLSGRHSVESGFATLLRGSGLEAAVQENGGYTLRRVPAGGVVLPKVSVVGNDAESAYGPVIGYAAKRSATATKTDTPLRDIPQAIQVVPAQVVEDQRALILEDAVRNVSGVYRENTFANTLDRFTLRGFTQSEFLRDGYRDSQSGIRSLVGIERVEVLKGPASILYGRLEPGGAINMVSKRPQRESANTIDIEAGNYDYYRATVDSTGAMDDDGTFLYRFSGAWQDAGTFREDVDVDNERLDLAPSLTWNISERTELWLQLNYLRSEVPFDRGLVAVGDKVADIPNDRFLGEPDDYLFNEQYGFTLEFTHAFNEWLSLRQGWRSAWRDSDDYRAEPSGSVNALGNLNRRFSMNDDDGFSHMWQTDLIAEFQTGAIEHQLLFGFDLSRDERGGVNGSNPINVPINIYDPVYGATPLTISALARNDRNTTDASGIYVQDQIALTQQLKLLIGARFDKVDYTGRNFLNDTERNQKDDAWTPRVGVMWQPMSQLSLYASYSEGFNPQTGGNLANGNQPEPTRSKQYEVGVKSELLDGRLTSTLAIFDLTKQDVTTTDPDDSDFVVQTGEMRSQGIELDVTGELLPGWDLIASYAYIDAEVTEDNNTPVGNNFASVPENGASLWSVYRLQSGALRGWGFGGGVYYVDERYGDLANSFVMPSYTRTDATLFYEADRWRAALNVKNLFDRDYYAAASSRLRIDPGIPLTVIGSIGWRF